MKFLFCFLLLIPFAQSIAASSMSFEKLEKLIKDHPEVDSVEGLLQFLPKQLRNRFVLMHTSGSLHKECVTPENPRVIFYDEDATFILAAANPNGSADCRSKMVEIIEFKEKEARFEFHSVEFLGKGKKAVVSEANPARCLTCHSSDPRPMWGSYFVWPGAYGGLDDSMLESKFIRSVDRYRKPPLETVGYEKFMGQHKDKGIYQFLVWENGRDVLNMGRPNGRQTKPQDWKPYSAFYRPNFVLQLELQRLNGKRIERLIKKDPEYKTFWDAIHYTQYCEERINGLKSIIDDLPSGAREYFSQFVIPTEVPRMVKTVYENHALKGEWGYTQEIEKYNPFMAQQLLAYEKAIQRLEVGIPREWWGYLRIGDVDNVSNTELPRYPEGDWGSVMYAAELASAMEFFLNLRGLSMKAWPYTREGYIGTASEISYYNRHYLSRPEGGLPKSCEETKQRAVENLTQWWKRAYVK